MENLNKFRERLVNVALDLLHLSILLAQKLKQNDRVLATGRPSADIQLFLKAAMDRVQFDSINYTSREGVDEQTQKLLATLASKLREYLLQTESSLLGLP